MGEGTHTTGDRERAHKFSNRLIHETSPYLLQHAHNPVDWYPWGSEALERARAEDKPILLSVGYSACHWCHVLAHESFENEETAALMNRLFVSIKVDREERPDIDALYMLALQRLTGGGGWPMTMFLLPDASPFLGGTYFPPEPRYGSPAFPDVLRRVDQLYRTRREEVERQAAALRDLVRAQGEVRLDIAEGIAPAEIALDPALLARAAENHLPSFDERHGGFRPAPKFPHPLNLAFLLRMLDRWRADRHPTGAESTLAAHLLPLVCRTLDAMADGGIYDQIGGGFHRYSTDAIWLVPHFEKMLYDNALLAPVYLHAWQLTGEDRYRRVCEETLDYVLREMTDAEGGFASAQDADSEGVEGNFYVWTASELRAALDEALNEALDEAPGAENATSTEDASADATIAARVWGVTEAGNFEGSNILHVAASAREVAAALGMDEERVRAAITRARAQLYTVRAARVWPAKDDKVLAAWNGLMQRAFAEAGRALDRTNYRDAAVANVAFLRAHLLRDGRLGRNWRAGTRKPEGYLEDYGAVINALLSTYEATGDTELFRDARALADGMLTRFWDADAGTFFDTAADAEPLIGRPRDITEGVTPSGMSLAAEALLRLAAFSGEGRYRDVAARTILPLAEAMAESPLAFGHLLCALDDFIGPFYEVALVGDAADRGTAALRRALDGLYFPRGVLAQAAPEDGAAREAVPLLADRGLVGGRATAYVCQGFVCRQPVTEPGALLGLLES